MLEPEYAIGVDAVLDRIEFDDGRAKLWESIVATIRLVCEDPGDSRARRHSLRLPNGTTIWRVPIPAPGEDQYWSMLWELTDDTVLIDYIGVWPPPQKRP